MEICISVPLSIAMVLFIDLVVTVFLALLKPTFLPRTAAMFLVSLHPCCLFLISEQRFLWRTPHFPLGSKLKAGWRPVKQRHTASVTGLATEC